MTDEPEKILDDEGRETDDSRAARKDWALNYGRFDAKPVDEDYNAEARQADRERDIYASRRSSRPAYTRPNPAGTVVLRNVVPGTDKVTFPLMKQNSIKKLREDELVSPQGSLWRLQRHIADIKFELLKQCIAAAEHMVTDISAEIVIRVEATTLTDKAKAITRVTDPTATEVSILLPNGEFQLGGY